MGVQDAGRRAFLLGRSPAESLPLRPPWALPEPDFNDACTRCGGCIDVCPEGIIRSAADGLPEVDFQRGACTFCGACLERCQSGSLQRSEFPWLLRARVDDTCLAAHGVHCQACRDLCEAEAIRFLPVRGVAQPSIDSAACSGCGACIGACPVAALSVSAGGRP